MMPSKNQAEFVTMGGVDGDFQDGLSEFKSNFAPYIREYIGEFDLPVHRVFICSCHKGLPLAKNDVKEESIKKADHSAFFVNT